MTLKSTKIVDKEEFPSGVYKAYILNIIRDNNDPTKYSLNGVNYSNITNRLISNDQLAKYFSLSKTVTDITDLRNYRKPEEILKRPFPVQHELPKNWIDYLNKQIELRGKNKLFGILDYEDDFSNNDMKEFNRARSPDNIKNIHIPQAKAISQYELYYQHRDCDLFMLLTYEPVSTEPEFHYEMQTVEETVIGCPYHIPNCPNHPDDGQPHIITKTISVPIPNPDYIYPWWDHPEYEAYKYYNTRIARNTDKKISIKTTTISYIETEEYVNNLKAERLTKLYKLKAELEYIQEQLRIEYLRLDPHYPTWDIENQVLKDEYENIIVPLYEDINNNLDNLIIELDNIEITNLQNKIDEVAQELFVLFRNYDETDHTKLKSNFDYDITKTFQTIRICYLTKYQNLEEIEKLREERNQNLENKNKIEEINKKIKELQDDNDTQDENIKIETNSIRNKLSESKQKLKSLEYNIEHLPNFISMTQTVIANLEAKIPPLEEEIKEIEEEIEKYPNCENKIVEDLKNKKIISASVFNWFTPDSEIELVDRPKVIIFLSLLKRYFDLISTFYLLDYNYFMDICQNPDLWHARNYDISHPDLDHINGQIIYGFEEKEVQPFAYLSGRFYPSVIYLKSVIRNNSKAYCIAYGPDGVLYITYINSKYYQHLYDIL